MKPKSLSRTRAAARITMMLGALTVAVVGVSRPVAAVAADEPSGQPPVPQLIAQDPGPHGYFEYTLAPGERRNGAVAIHNPSTVAATFSLYATDASTSTATGVIYGGLGAKVVAGGAWLGLAQTSLDLGPDETRTVPFVIAVPAGAGPGDHVAGISAQNPTSTAQHGTATNAKQVGVALDVSTRVVTAVVVHVPGPAAPGLAIGAPALHTENGNRQVVDLPMNATGQLLIKPHLTVSLRSCGKAAELAHLDRQLDTFVPATSIVYQWPLQTLVLQPGCYRLDASATLGPTELSRVTGTVTVDAAQAAIHPLTGTTSEGASTGPHHPARHNLTMVALGGLALSVPTLLLLVLVLLRSRRRRRELENELARLAAQASATATTQAHR